MALARISVLALVAVAACAPGQDRLVTLEYNIVGQCDTAYDSEDIGADGSVT